jgi:hypothetical protein
LAALLSASIDFQPRGRMALEQYFLERCGDALKSNSTLHASTINALLGIDGTTRCDDDTLVSLFSHNVLNDAQREWLFEHERRPNSWPAFLEYQPTSGDDLIRMLGLGLGEPFCTFLAERPRRFALKDRPEYESILDGANACVQLAELKASPKGAFESRLARWAPGLRGFDDNADCVNDLVEHRPEMFNAMLFSGSSTLRRGIASSRHCIDVDQQMLVAGLSEAPSVFSEAELDTWLCTYGRTLLSLVNNPRCTLDVLLELQRRFAAMEGIELSEDAVDHVKSTGRALTRRLADNFTSKPTVKGDYESIKDLAIAEWLVKRSVGTNSGANVRWYDVEALKQNRFLSRELRRKLDRVRIPYQIEEHADFKSRDATPQTTAAELQADRRARADAQPVGSSRTLGAQSVRELTNEMERDFTDSPHYAQWLVKRLGVDPKVWMTFFGLAADWDGSMTDLVSTTKILSKKLAVRVD